VQKCDTFLAVVLYSLFWGAPIRLLAKGNCANALTPRPVCYVINNFTSGTTSILNVRVSPDERAILEKISTAHGRDKREAPFTARRCGACIIVNSVERCSAPNVIGLVLVSVEEIRR
jgi:hypothetical protein